MKLNQPKNLLLFLITLGSGILAIPGAFGSYVLILATIESFTKEFDYLALLLPVALIGHFLLLGYFWTAWNKKFVKWFWLISMVFNLLMTFLCGISIIKEINWIIFLLHNLNLFGFLYLLFSLWTLFVAIASAKYAFFSPTTEDLHLP